MQKVSEYLLTVLLFLSCIFSCFSQKEIKGTIDAGDSVRVIINSISPLEFPMIEVLFKAEDLKGYPYWGLKKQHLIATENGTICSVVSLEHFSQNEPIHIALVLDHSGSMSESLSYRFVQRYKKKYPKDEYIDLEKDTSWKASLVYPLEDAKKAIRSFIEHFNVKKDKIGLVAFSSTVDASIAPTSEIGQLFRVLDTLDPTESTAFYDAILVAIESLTGLEGINVVIALTDGCDNASMHTPKEIVASAKKHNVPIYCIGLGDVETETLKKITSSTNGFFAYANSSSSLDSVYQVLERKIKAYYLLKYNSENWNSDEVERSFTLKFDVENIVLKGNSETMELPDKVVAYLKSKEDKQFYTYLIGGATIVVTALGLGAFLFYRKKKKKLTIVRVYPNPGNGIFTLLTEIPADCSKAILIIRNHSGISVFEDVVVNGLRQIDISTFGYGLYFMELSADGFESAEWKYFMR